MRQARWALGRRTSIGFALAAAATVLAGLAGVDQVRSARHVGELVRHTLEVERQIAQVEIDLLNAEAAQRGYLLTGEVPYLAPYERGRVAVRDGLERLARLVAGDPSQQERVRTLGALADVKLAEMRETIEKRQPAGLPPALATAAVGSDKQTMDRIREVLAEAQAEERSVLARRTQERADRFTWASRVVMLASALAALVVALSTLSLERNLRRRQQAEWQVRESEERLRVTLASIGDAVIATDPDGRVVFMNTVGAALTGWSPDDAKGRDLVEVFRILDERTRAAVESPVTKVLREGVVVGLANHTMLVARDGRETAIDDSGAPIRDAGGEIMGVVLVFRDVSERKQIEGERERLWQETAARAEAERVSHAKDEFLAVLSHELRSPLQGITGWLGVLRETRSDPAQQQRALLAIERGVRQQARLVNDILDASRIVAGKLQLERAALDLGAVVQECVDQLLPVARDKQVEVSSDIDACGRVLGDQFRLHQSIANVLSNAVKFTAPGGRVDVRCHREDDEIVVTVRDTGTGIAPELLPHIFDRFRQATAAGGPPASGLGLGLSIVRQIVELHGGAVRAHSSGAGQGATFVLRIPVAEDMSEAASDDTAREQFLSTLAGISVVVVDDDDDTRESLALLLSLRGAATRSAASVDEALALIAAQRPDVVVSDISMPQRDGYALARALQGAIHARPAAVALTGFASEHDRERATSAGFDAHIAKPVDLEQLVLTIRSLTVPRPA